MRLFSFVFLLIFLASAVSAGTLDDIRDKLKGDESNIIVEEGSDSIVVLDKKEAEKLHVSDKGRMFFQMYGTGWKHAMSGDFIYHFRKISNMKKIARIAEKIYREILGDISMNGKMLEDKGEISIYMIDDENKWKGFLGKAGVPLWAAGFVSGNEIFLHIDWGDIQYRSFAIRLLTHELAHIIFHRSFPVCSCAWLNEGFAEYQEHAVGEYIKQAAYPRTKEMNEINFYDLDELVQLQSVPSGGREGAFYLQSRRLVTFLYGKHGKEKFLEFVEVICAGIPFQEAVMKVYKDKYPNYKIFKSKASRHR